MFERVRLRLVVANVLVIAGILLVLGVGIVVAMDRFLVDQRAETLRTVAREIVERLQDDPADVAGLPAARSRVRSRPPGPRAASSCVDPAAIGADALQPAGRERRPGRIAGRHPSALRWRGGGRLVPRAGRRGHPGRSGPGVGPRHRAAGRAPARARRVVGLVLAVVAGWVLADRAVRPIRRAFERQREFAADASHELRTPLAVVDAGPPGAGPPPRRHRRRRTARPSTPCATRSAG